MPACAIYHNGKYRVVECDTLALVRNRAGTPIDGGGHNTRAQAEAQARAVNANMPKKG